MPLHGWHYPSHLSTRESEEADSAKEPDVGRQLQAMKLMRWCVPQLQGGRAWAFPGVAANIWLRDTVNLYTSQKQTTHTLRAWEHIWTYLRQHIQSDIPALKVS